MKLAYLHYLYGNQAGLHHVRQFVDAARKLGSEVDVHALHPFAREGHRVGAAEPTAATTARRALGRYLHEPRELLRTLPYAHREIRLLRSDLPDVLLVRNSHLNQSAILVALRLELPLVIELNAPPEESRLYLDQYWHIPWLPEWLEGWKLRRADGIVTVSSWTRRHLVERYGVDFGRISVVPNGADLEAFHPGLEPAPDLPERFRSGTVVGFVGSFLNWHGSDLLGRLALDVAEARPEVCFLFVGDGPEAGALQKMTSALGERVLFTGRVPHDYVPKLVGAIDIAVLPDSHFYGSPLKVIEWMAAGKAIVAPRYVPLEDVIDDGVQGLLFPPRDGEALVRSVTQLVDQPELRLSLGDAAAERARSALSWEHNARLVLEACERARSNRLTGTAGPHGRRRKKI